MAELHNIDLLAKDYKRRAENGGKWTDYVKAHGLANFCVVKDSTEVRRKLVYDIEDSWYNGQHPLSYVEHQQLIKQHKSCLKSYRTKTRDENKELDAAAMGFDLLDIFSKENLDKAQAFSNQVFDKSKKCCEGLVEFSRHIIESSVDILKRSSLTTSCRFAVIGLGSIAKGETTPYSDLEYAFIVESGNSEYFEKLAVDSYFRIGNLGETPLKYFDIAEMKVAKNTSSDTTRGSTPPVPKDIAAGYRIDGLMRKAGNIPTGNGRMDGQSLTLTVEEFIELYKSSAKAPFDGMPGDLSDKLASSVLIYTNEGQTSQLYDDFVKARIAYESTKGENAAAINTKRLKSFQADIHEYTFLPDFVRFQPPSNTDIKIKTDIFRYPTLLANNIKMFWGLNNQYSWEIFSHLHAKEILSDVKYRYMNIVLALSIYMRTSAYINYGSQTEILSLTPTISSSLPSKYSVPTALFILFGSLLSPIKQAIKRAVENVSSEDVCLTHVTISIFESMVVNEMNFFRNAEVCYFAGHYYLAKMNLEKAFGKSLDSISLQKVLQAVVQSSEGPGSGRKFVELCCYILYYTRSFVAAVKYFQWIITDNPDREDIALLKLLTAHCLKVQGDFQMSQTMLHEVEQHLTQHGEEFYVGDSKHEDSSSSYNNIAAVYHIMGEPRKAVAYFTKGLRVCKAIYGETENSTTSSFYQNIGSSYFALGDHTLALKYFTKSLNIKEAVYGVSSDHPHTALNYDQIGMTYSDIGKNTSALEYHFKALNMRKALYGTNTSHSDVADSYDHMGNAYLCLGDYKRALKYYNKSLDMEKALYGANTDHLDIAGSYDNIGNAHQNLGNHILALDYHTKSLAMQKAIRGTNTDHPDIAGSYNNIGNAHQILGDHMQALKYHTKSLAMKKAVFGTYTNRPDIAISYYNIGTVNFFLRKYTLALEYHTMSLNMREAMFGATSNHPDIAASYSNIGKVYYHLGNYTSALKYYIK